MKDFFILFGYVLVMFFSLCAVCIVLFSMTGCSGKEVVRTEYKEILVPTPQKCDFNISHAPEINTGEMQQMLKSLKDLSYDSKELRQIIKETPCLNVNYKNVTTN